MSLTLSAHPPTWRRHPSLVHNEIINTVWLIAIWREGSARSSQRLNSKQGLAGELNYVTFLWAGEKSYGVINGLLDIGGWRQTYDQISLCAVVFGRSKDGLISYYENHGDNSNAQGEEYGWTQHRACAYSTFKGRLYHHDLMVNKHSTKSHRYQLI